MSDAKALPLSDELAPDAASNGAGALHPALEAGTQALLRWALEQLPEEPMVPAYSERDVLLSIMGNQPLPKGDGAGGAEAIMRRVLEAPTLREAMEGGSTSTIDKVLGLTVAIENPRWYGSDYEQGALCFCVVECTEVGTGLVHTLVVGSQQPQVIIWRAWCEDALPVVGRFSRSAKATQAGFFPYNFGPA